MISFSDPVKDLRATAAGNYIDLGSGIAQLLLYDGTRPASGEAVTDQVLLCSLSLPQPALKGVVNGVLELHPIGESLVLESGSPSWGRLLNRDGNFVCDADAGLAAPGIDIVVAVANVIQGAMLRADSIHLTEL